MYLQLRLEVCMIYIQIGLIKCIDIICTENIEFGWFATENSAQPDPGHPAV